MRYICPVGLNILWKNTTGNAASRTNLHSGRGLTSLCYTLAHEGYGPLSLRCCLATSTITDEALSFILFYSSVQDVLYLYSSVVLGNLTIDAKVNIIRNLMYELAKDLKEGDRTYNNEIFKHLIRASSLTKIVGLDEQRAIDFLVELKESCKHLSYYWIQLGILYRTSEQFEEAENAFEYAKKLMDTKIIKLLILRQRTTWNGDFGL